MKLHLGCGRRYLEGYVNVDYPPSDHTVQSDLRADHFGDLVTLSFPLASVDEIRLHHVFEHFSRGTALALLCRWREWLKPDGVLRIETPDLIASARLLAAPWVRYGDKQQVVRHLFGSHESHWAVHWDGWSATRFMQTLPAIGYASVIAETHQWGLLRNVEVNCRRGSRVMSLEDYRTAVGELLKESLVRTQEGADRGQIATSELDLLEVWLSEWQRVYCASGHAL